jgi:GTP-binding protein
LAAWHAKWQQKAPRRKPKQKSDDQLSMEKLRDQALYRDQKAQQKRAKRVAAGSPALPAAVASTSTPHEQPFVPPALLLPTGSPHVFISKTAAQQASLDPRTLFAEAAYQGDSTTRPLLFRTHSFVYAGVARLADTPAHKVVPTVAFLGRSNVGKSSLVNALMRRDLARCSKQPGRTQQVHRFALTADSNNTNNNNKGGNNNNHNDPYSATLESCAGLFLDLPGYGYAVAPDNVLEEWQRRTQQVLRQTQAEGHLRRVYWLVDARLGLTAVDHSVGAWLQESAQLAHTLVWTKVDSVAKPQLIKGINEACLWYQKQVFVAEQAGEPCLLSPVIHATSTKGSGGGQGLSEVLASIETEFLIEDGDDYSYL